MVRPFKYTPLKKLPFKYLPPNFATAANMIIGILAVLFSVKGEFELAAWLVVLCVFLDGLDGMLARLLKAQSHFGIEFDSFSDFVAFGIAPAAVVLSYVIYGDFATGPVAHMIWISIIGAIFYILMSAIRLARFNVQTVALGDRIFHGIPTTACAGLIASAYLTLNKYGNPVKDPADLVFMSCATFAVFGFLMVSTIPLMKLRRRRRTFLTVSEKGVQLFCAALAVTRVLPEVLLAVGLLYIVFGVRGGIMAERELKRQQAEENEPAAAVKPGEEISRKPRPSRP
jgi:CDP-diacylglycerol--serine O-phosphatidyltransferase